MTLGRLFQHFLARLLPLLVLGLAAVPAGAQSDPPGRVGRLNHAEGVVTFSTSGDNEWTDAEPNRPLTRGDRLWTDRAARAEIQIGSSAVRLDGKTQLEILSLDDQSAQLSVTQGTVYVRIRSLPEGENFEIDTPNLAYRAAYPGDYRIDVDPVRGTTRVTIHSGTGAVYGEGGQALPLGGGQQITFKGRLLAQFAAQESPPQDNFDRWAAERNRREDQSVSARYVPREVVGYQQLDSHGQWAQDTTYGPVWYPQATAANWAPYRDGRWEWIAPWGWTWIDKAAWGFAPFHYGRWALIGTRWAWVPGRIGLRPVYAPALVAFIGGTSGGINWTTAIGGGRPAVAWFPLAPGEAWQPGYRTSPVYISSINRGLAVAPNASYAHQRRPDALTAIPAEDFHRGRPARSSWLRVAGNALTNAQVVPPPPMPERTGSPERDRTAVARAAPPAPTDIRQVANSVAASAQKPASAERAHQLAVLAQQQAVLTQQQAQRAEQLKAAEQARTAQQAQAQQAALQARAAEQAKLAQQGKALEQAKLANEAKAAQEARLAQQLKAAQQTKVAEQSRASQEARAGQQARLGREAKLAAEQARVAEQVRSSAQAARVAQQQARLAAKATQAVRVAEASRIAVPSRRELLARRAEESKREQAAKRDIALREHLAKRERAAAKRELVAKRAEQARREGDARRADLARREALERREDQQRRLAHAQQVEQARRAADRDAEVLRVQRTRREEQARREAQEKETSQREAWQRQQQALAEQWRKDHQTWEQQQQQQRDRTRQRPDLRDRQAPAEVWQRGVPILTPGRTS